MSACGFKVCISHSLQKQVLLVVRKSCGYGGINVIVNLETRKTYRN